MAAIKLESVAALRWNPHLRGEDRSEQERAPDDGGASFGGQSVDAHGRRTWPVDSYLTEGPRTTDWLAKGVVKQHRTIGTTLNLLIRAGFSIAHVEEWGPTDEQILATPELAEERDRPMFLLVAAQR